MNFTTAFLIDHDITFAYMLLALRVFFLSAKKQNRKDKERNFIFPVLSKAFLHLGKRKHDPGKCFQCLVLPSIFFEGAQIRINWIETQN